MVEKHLKTFGVYKITCTVNGNFYIGSTANSFSSRWYSHRYKLSSGTSPSTYLQYGWSKYGQDNFTFEIVEEVTDKLRVIEREQFYIDSLKPQYNILKIANSRLGIPCSLSTKSKMSSSAKTKGIRQIRLCKCGKEVRQTYDINDKFRGYLRTCGLCKIEAPNKGFRSKKRPLCRCGLLVKEEFQVNGRFARYHRTCGTQKCQTHYGRPVTKETRLKIANTLKSKIRDKQTTI